MISNNLWSTMTTSAIRLVVLRARLTIGISYYRALKPKAPPTSSLFFSGNLRHSTIVNDRRMYGDAKYKQLYQQLKVSSSSVYENVRLSILYPAYVHMLCVSLSDRIRYSASFRHPSGKVPTLCLQILLAVGAYNLRLKVCFDTDI